MNTIGDALRALEISVEKIAEADVAQFIADHRADILDRAHALQLSAENEIVRVLQEDLPTGGVWSLPGMRAGVSNAIAASAAQFVEDLGGYEPALLTAAQAWLTKQAASPP